MRRSIIAFLLLLLPIQFALASATGYCDLEKTKVPSHLGHHDHPGSVPVSDPEEDDGSGSRDVECGACHLGCAQIQAALPGVIALPLLSFAAPWADDRGPDHPQEPSERPPRTSLA